MFTGLVAGWARTGTSIDDCRSSPGCTVTATARPTRTSGWRKAVLREPAGKAIFARPDVAGPDDGTGSAGCDLPPRTADRWAPPLASAAANTTMAATATSRRPPDLSAGPCGDLGLSRLGEPRPPVTANPGRSLGPALTGPDLSAGPDPPSADPPSHT